VAADFDDQIEWNAANQALFARLLAQLARSAGLAPLDRDAVARVRRGGGASQRRCPAFVARDGPPARTC